MPKLILFDIDGTLLISRGASREAKARAMRDMFKTDEGVHEFPFGGKTDWQILGELLGRHGISLEEIGARMAEYERLMAHYMAQIIHNYPTHPCPGAHEVVQTLLGRDDVLIGLVTGNTSQTAPIKLKAAGFDPAWFAVGAYGSESHLRDDLPRLALDRANALTGWQIAPHEVIVVGDTLADLQCARALGAQAVIVMTGFEDHAVLRAAEPDYLLPDLQAFLPLLDQLLIG